MMSRRWPNRAGGSGSRRSSLFLKSCRFHSKSPARYDRAMLSLTLTIAFALAADPAPAARNDRFGDPLPPGAIQRLGTLRHPTGWPISGQYRLYLPGGRTLLTYFGEFRWSEADSGREIDRWAPPAGLEINGI